MPNILINIDVPDLAIAERFYAEAFRLRAGRRFGTAGVEMLGGDAPIYLLVKAPGSRGADTTDAERRYDRHWTPVHIDFVVDDIDGAVQRATAAGATTERAVSDQPWGRLALMADPFGNGFCFVEFVGRGYDAIAEA
jgi:predicted enzyme related to lactoylglutathione lyase